MKMALMRTMPENPHADEADAEQFAPGLVAVSTSAVTPQVRPHAQPRLHS